MNKVKELRLERMTRSKYRSLLRVILMDGIFK